MNVVAISCRLGRNPERVNSENGTMVVLSVARTDNWTDRGGSKQSRTNWFKVVCFGSVAENAMKFLSTGRQVNITGRLQSSTWEEEDTQKKRSSVEIVAQTIEYVGARPESQEEAS